MGKVLGMGNALVDIMTRMKDDRLLGQMNLPKGTMQLVDHAFIRDVLDKTVHLPKSISSGGSAANTIHGLASLGVHTAFIGKVGNDEFGEIFQSDLQKNHIQPMLFYGLNETGRAMALVSADGERTFATFLGAAVELSEDDIDSSLFSGYSYFHIEGYLVQNHHLIEKAVRLAKKANLQVSLDMASFNVVEANRQFLGTLVEEYVDIVFANEEEARAYTGLDPLNATSALAKECHIAVVKVGERGSYVQKGDEIVHIKPIDAKCIDTTGAGDLYAAGFLYGMLEGLNLEKCGRLGSLLAGHVIQTLGAKIGTETWQVIREEAERIRKDQ